MVAAVAGRQFAREQRQRQHIGVDGEHHRAATGQLAKALPFRAQEAGARILGRRLRPRIRGAAGRGRDRDRSASWPAITAPRAAACRTSAAPAGRSRHVGHHRRVDARRAAWPQLLRQRPARREQQRCRRSAHARRRASRAAADPPGRAAPVSPAGCRRQRHRDAIGPDHLGRADAVAGIRGQRRQHRGEQLVHRRPIGLGQHLGAAGGEQPSRSAIWPAKASSRISQGRSPIGCTPGSRAGRGRTRGDREGLVCRLMAPFLPRRGAAGKRRRDVANPRRSAAAAGGSCRPKEMPMDQPYRERRKIDPSRGARWATCTPNDRTGSRSGPPALPLPNGRRRGWPCPTCRGCAISAGAG